MAGAYDITTILDRELREYRVPASAVAAVAGIAPSRVSTFISQNKCPVAYDIPLREAWARIKRLIEFCAPIRVDFSRTAELKHCLGLMETGELQIVVIKNDIDTQHHQ